MCGRFVRYSPISELIDEFSVDEPSFDLNPNYNVSPGQTIPVVINDGKKRLELCKWGFIPFWSKDPKIGQKMINARAETVAEKPSFKRAFFSSRILIPANGFYEWKKEGKGKTPFFIHLKSKEILGFAGLLSVWTDPEGKQLSTCTIVTTDANSLLKKVHNRMPVILSKDDQDLWLDRDNKDRDRLTSVLRPYAPDKMEFLPVSTLVNSPSHNSPDCIIPA